MTRTLMITCMVFPLPILALFSSLLAKLRSNERPVFTNARVVGAEYSVGSVEDSDVAVAPSTSTRCSTRSSSGIASSRARFLETLGLSSEVDPSAAADRGAGGSSGVST